MTNSLQDVTIRKKRISDQIKSILKQEEMIKIEGVI